MMVGRADLSHYLDELLRPSEFSDYCPNGLQVEGRAEIECLISGVTASQLLIEAARERNADALLVHHGYFWRDEDRVVTGMNARRLRALLTSDISLLAYHLPLDAHEEFGNNVQLAEHLGLEITGLLQPGFAGNRENWTFERAATGKGILGFAKSATGTSRDLGWA